ncbi:MAG: hypothetical protein UH241_10265 [Acutalibacteraceae bacterium]|nr:hypothetical protein [Acutalibacteraceae bacterium]
MLKRILCTFLCVLIILIPFSVISVSANEHGGSSGSLDDDLSNVNLWDYNMWSDILPEGYQLPSDIDNYVGYQSQFFYGYTSEVLNSYAYVDFWNSGMTFTNNDKDIGLCSIGVAEPTDVYSLYVDRIDNIFSKKYENVSGYLWTLDNRIVSDESKVFIVNDLSVYKSMVSDMGSDEDKTIYYCDNIIQSLKDYINFLKYDEMFFDVYPVADGCQNIIRFYDCFDSYYGKYQYDFFEDNMLNYLNSSFSINSPIYYQPKGIDTNHQLDGAELQHNEMYYIYIPVPNDFNMSQTNEYLTSIGSAVHFEKGFMDFGSWYDTYIKPWLSRFNANSEYKLVTLRDVEPSTTDNPTVNTTDEKQDINLLRLTFPSAYTFLESSENNGGFIMTGCRTMSTGQKVDLSNGSIDNSAKDGIGANIDGGDYSEDKDRDDLLADGWKNGFPNKSSFPYKITVNKNGYILYEIYFDKKPTIQSNFYSDSQIAYDIDFNLTRGYVYAKQQNCYIDFNFRNDNEDDYLTSDGTLTDSATDKIRKSMANKFAQMVDCFVNGVGYFTQKDYEYVNYEKYLTQKIMRFWTNYTGQLTGVYRGYYVQFNWDLESDDNFIKNNSDDDHNYSDDYLADEGFTDNNGNIHGGAVDTPTESPDYNGFNNEDFSFDENNLWKYADSFLGFCARAFKVLPSFIWQLIGCSIVIVIVLRIVGR